MSRAELAEAVNAWLMAETGKAFCMDATHIARFELGEYRWPREYYRRALRAVLGARTDRELGFFVGSGLSDDDIAFLDTVDPPMADGPGERPPDQAKPTTTHLTIAAPGAVIIVIAGGADGELGQEATRLAADAEPESNAQPTA